MRALRFDCFVLAVASIFCCAAHQATAADYWRDLQTSAAAQNKADWGHWGGDAEKYSTWFSHSNRLIPIYTFGIKLDAVRGENSVYRSKEKLKHLYGYEPEGTLNPTAEYFDQTDVARLQQMAADAGKKRIVLFVFDGMDWQTTWNAAIQSAGKVSYTEGRGAGLHFQDYRGAETDYGYFATSPHNEGTKVNVDTQTLKNPGGEQRGGYNWNIAGTTPWTRASILDYCIGKCKECSQAYTDSASSATSLCSGIKTFNDSINVDAVGRQVESVARKLQKKGFAIGVVTSVPVSHATPAAAYANNVHRDDYQDLTRDLVGLPSVSHPEPLQGVDVLIGGGWGDSKSKDKAQGANYVPGNTYITEADLKAIDAAQGSGGRYRVVQRTADKSGREILQAAADEAAAKNQRLFGMFGVESGHLPFQTADGKYDPTMSVRAAAEKYSAADVAENPTLADFAVAALTVLSKNDKGFWLMVEAGDVDWANHANNVDNSIGAVKSGDAAFKAVCDWIESHGGWDDAAVLVTADHGHYFFLEKPEMLLPPSAGATAAK
jgi:alkaline phosphatase